MWGFIIIQVRNMVAAIDFIPELCKGYVARNFVWAMSCNSFIDVPYNFLCACIEHPHLTIDSEKKLCEALLLWVSNNGESSQCSLESSNGCYTDILKKVRISLLPLSFVAGSVCLLIFLTGKEETATLVSSQMRVSVAFLIL